jgi:aerobic-type carbon monoxide dehydrogenase small subunit (CoxS/CutS family)
VVPAASFDGKSIRTVEGHAKNGGLSVLQKAFIEHFAFQCGHCPAGFLNESQILLERLAKTEPFRHPYRLPLGVIRSARVLSPTSRDQVGISPAFRSWRAI